MKTYLLTLEMRVEPGMKSTRVEVQMLTNLGPSKRNVLSGQGGAASSSSATQPTRPKHVQLLFRDYDFATTLRGFIGVIEDWSLRAARVLYEEIERTLLCAPVVCYALEF